MSKISYRDTLVEVSLDAIKHNISIFRNFINDNCRLMAVVKADGYGHGAIEIASTAIKEGADYLAVALLDEAIDLRADGITTPILVLGYIPLHGIENAINENVTITVFDDNNLDQIIQIATNLKRTIKIHLKVDTGMSRIGVTTKEAALNLAKKAEAANFINLEGIFTHFANADSPDPNPTYKQFAIFSEILEYLMEHGINLPIKHCCNSAATMRFPEMHLDMVRVGISLYGLLPSPEMKNELFPLKQAITFKTRIIALKTIKAGQGVGYGSSYITDKETIIATIPVGYADGLSRQLSNQGYVLLKRKKAPIVGRVCMDQAMIDVSDIDSVILGDEVYLLGGNEQDGFISVDEVAQKIGTINYEVTCLIGKRVPRLHNSIIFSQ